MEADEFSLDCSFDESSDDLQFEEDFEWDNGIIVSHDSVSASLSTDSSDEVSDEESFERLSVKRPREDDDKMDLERPGKKFKVEYPTNFLVMAMYVKEQEKEIKKR